MAIHLGGLGSPDRPRRLAGFSALHPRCYEDIPGDARRTIATALHLNHGSPPFPHTLLPWPPSGPNKHKPGPGKIRPVLGVGLPNRIKPWLVAPRMPLPARMVVYRRRNMPGPNHRCATMMIALSVSAARRWYHAPSVVVDAVGQPSSAAGPFPRARGADEMRHGRRQSACAAQLALSLSHVLLRYPDLVPGDTSSRPAPLPKSSRLGKGLPECCRLSSYGTISDRATLFHLSTSSFQSARQKSVTLSCMNHAIAWTQRLPPGISLFGSRLGQEKVHTRPTSSDRFTTFGASSYG
ncbi:uncharacterized protein P884DRAFT_260306 [Thermothelomyces heterothallicus CBS 202.75]|uniref:uncharacterized protein n=1 Tax=Thermothelomyces heterothallicus CBS 202.75 TaxID=1149848 RepID=UPI0037442D45